MILPVCVGHLEPLFPLWSGFHSIGARPNSPLGEYTQNLRIAELEYYCVDDSDLSEYYHLFKLMRFLKHKCDPSLVMTGKILIIHYRRFLSSVPLGTVSENQIYSHVLRPSMVPRDGNHLLRDVRADWFCSPVLDLQRTVYEQFANHHPLGELIKFLAALSADGILSNNECRDFLNDRRMIAVCSLGLSPLRFFINTMEILERAVFSYLKRWGNPMLEGYQRRVLGFLCERLHSFLLIRELECQNSLTPRSIGYQIVISDLAFVNASGR
jgi:hypothetical protein